MVVAVGPGEDAAPGTRPLATRLRRGQWGSIPPIVPGGGDGTTAYFGDVAVVSPDDVWAVGASWTSQGGPAAAQVLVEHYDGRRWTIVEAPNPGAAETRLEAVAASGPDDVWAVGSTVDGTIARAIAQHWDGSSWSLVPVPDATGGGSGSSLSAVEALAPDDVWAVGWSSTGTMANRPTPPVVLHFDGTTWRSHELPVPDDTFVAPFAVTAPAANDVWIVGWQGGSNLGEHYGRLTPFVVPTGMAQDGASSMSASKIPPPCCSERRRTPMAPCGSSRGRAGATTRTRSSAAGVPSSWKAPADRRSPRARTGGEAAA
jgi:hypothetical protein